MERDLPVTAAGPEPGRPLHDIRRPEEAAEERSSQGGERHYLDERTLAMPGHMTALA